MSDLRATISKLERDYANHREAFKKWKDEHATLAGHASYNVAFNYSKNINCTCNIQQVDSLYQFTQQTNQRT